MLHALERNEILKKLVDGDYSDADVISLYDEVHRLNQIVQDANGIVELDLEGGILKRGETVLVTIPELLFILGSAVEYANSFPSEVANTFVQELRERIGMGLTQEIRYNDE